LIKKFGLNALEIERLTGVPASTIYRLLKSDGNPTIEVLKKLATFFQITVSQLIGEEPIGCKQIPLVPALEVANFFKLNPEEKSKFDSIPIDFPLNQRSFASICQDNTMEPFILKNSIVIIDPDREITNKDFVFLIKKDNDQPRIRQLISDGENYYLKILNSDFPVELTKIIKQEYTFIGVIVHYRTNLFDFNKVEQSANSLSLVKSR
ncbi:TPA: helix-turn-helix domain-containing protein, partial [Legionella pneumophila subsp. pneumophila]|nr:helix-turn-helix domain-containing protein [Legionella pneumophila subsp. pneumophila]